jgi:hypothetical protein
MFVRLYNEKEVSFGTRRKICMQGSLNNAYQHHLDFK